jgi:hypothetical protein
VPIAVVVRIVGRFLPRWRPGIVPARHFRRVRQVATLAILRSCLLSKNRCLVRTVVFPDFIVPHLAQFAAPEDDALVLTSPARHAVASQPFPLSCLA